MDKPNGSKRLILNLKALNKFIIAPHFKLEDLKTVLRLVSKGCWMASIDLQDTNWEISDFAFSKIKFTFKKFDIDLFATINNAKCSVFFSWLPDPVAEAVDAFTVQWTYLNFTLFRLLRLFYKFSEKFIMTEQKG